MTIKALASRTDEVSTLINGVAYARTPIVPINVWKMRVYLANAQTFADGTTVTVNFDTASAPGGYDSSLGFNATTHQYTVLVAGYYQTNVVVGLQSPANNGATNTILASLWRVGDVNALADGAQGAFYNNTFGAAPIGASLSDIVYLNAGDQVFVKVSGTGNGAGTWTIQASVAPGYVTYWSMHLISA